MHITEQLQRKIDLKTKPLGALGLLETIALQIGAVQNTESPVLRQPHILVFAADHGIAQSGVSAYPPEVTYQMVLNFLQGGAAINVFCRQHGIALKIVDAGVNHVFPPAEALIDAKIALGTHNFLHQKAMSAEQLAACLDRSAALVGQVADSGCNVIGFGEMGIGNTASAAMLMHYFCRLPIEQCVGRGTGIDDAQLARKMALLQQARDLHGDLSDPMEVLCAVGGFEIAQICGGMLAAFDRNMLILVDGFIASAAFLVAHARNPDIQRNAIFCHLSDENGHRKMLDFLGAEPLLRLGMRLGEGTGCAVAWPILESAVAFLNEMASFDSANVTHKDGQ